MEKPNAGSASPAPEKTMDTLHDLVRLSVATGERFTLLRQLAEKVFRRNSTADCFALAQKLFIRPEHQSRALASYILGLNAAKHPESLAFMHKQVSLDKEWRVQEILAQSFDNFCSIAGYEKSLPVISSWLSDSNPNVRRAVTEGLRIWTSRPYFKEHPERAVRMLSALRADGSSYVRTSVGNALKDISKKHKELVTAEIDTWDLSIDRVRETFKYASKHFKTGKSK